MTSDSDRAKEEKTPFSKGSKNFAQEQFSETFFSGTLEGVLIPKKLKILLRGLLSHKGPFLEFYDQTTVPSNHPVFGVFCYMKLVDACHQKPRYSCG